MKFILLINVKMPTIVGILTSISIINTTSERLKETLLFVHIYAHAFLKKAMGILQLPPPVPHTISS